MTPKERAKVLGQQLHKAALRSRTALLEAAIRDAENDIMARISERLESEPDPLSPASAAAIVRELMQTTITDLMSGQFSDPVRVVAFNTAERWAQDVSKDIALEIQSRSDIDGHDVPEAVRDFVDTYAGPDRQLALRLARVMSDARSTRYRRLALAEPDIENARLLRLLADEADRGVFVHRRVGTSRFENRNPDQAERS